MCNSVCVIQGSIVLLMVLCCVGTFWKSFLTKVPSHEIVFNLGVELDSFYRFCHHCFPSSISSFPFFCNEFFDQLVDIIIQTELFQSALPVCISLCCTLTFEYYLCEQQILGLKASIQNFEDFALCCLLVSQVAYETKTLWYSFLNNLLLLSRNFQKFVFSFPLKFTTFTKLYPGLEHFTLCMLDTLHDPTSEGVCVCARASVCVCFQLRKFLFYYLFPSFFVLNHFSCSFLYYTLV